MSELGIGCVQIGLDYGVSNSSGKPGLEHIRDIVACASQHQINTYDTAPVYGDSESRLGKILPAHSQIITKTRHFQTDSISQQHQTLLTQNLLDSLQKLNRDCVYALLVHDANDLLKPGSDYLYQQLCKLKQAGYITKIGVSVYNVKQVLSILKRYEIDLVQLPLNILDQRLLNDGVLDKLKKKDILIHVRSVFLQGLLLMQQQNRPEYFKRYANSLNDYFAYIHNSGLSPLEAALGFVFSLPQVDKVIVGVNHAKELEQIVQASKIKIATQQFSSFSSSEIELINPSLWKI